MGCRCRRRTDRPSRLRCSRRKLASRGQTACAAPPLQHTCAFCDAASRGEGTVFGPFLDRFGVVLEIVLFWSVACASPSSFWRNRFLGGVWMRRIPDGLGDFEAGRRDLGANPRDFRDFLEIFSRFSRNPEEFPRILKDLGRISTIWGGFPLPRGSISFDFL